MNARSTHLNPGRGGSTTQRPEHNLSAVQPTRILHTMLRVTNLKQSISFYCNQLGMTLHRMEDYPDGRFSLAFLGYGDEDRQAVLELTHNWEIASYDLGSSYGHLAIEVKNLDLFWQRLARSNVKLIRAPGAMGYSSPQRHQSEKIAFIEDPDGYRIELIEQ